MSIYLNASNSLSNLSLRLAQNLKDYHAGVFNPQWVITQTEGIQSWLRFNLAEQLGISANIQYGKPNDVIARIFLWLSADEQMVLDAETIKWHVFAIMGEEDFIQAYPEISLYYQGDAVKQISLAAELADLFDQYQIYRNEDIATWNKRALERSAALDWQEFIWHRLKGMLGENYLDRVQIAAVIFNRLKETTYQNLLKEKIPQVHFFGIAVITPYFLQLYQALSQFIDIHLYLTNPAPEQYWMEDKSEKQISRLLNNKAKHKRALAAPLAGNDLLLNWGQITKTSFGLLFTDDELINHYDNSLLQEPLYDTNLLSKIQTDIYQNAAPENRMALFESDLRDGSITLNGAYTPVREVEVLYNYLVKMVDESEGKYSARDILVMVSDIDKYAPFIQAVFKNAPYRFPFTIADETLTADNNMFSALQEVLMLDAHYFKAEQVLELLESPYIRKRFGITQTDSLREAVRQAGIIFGINGRQEDDTWKISWNYGLKKILYGICMSGSLNFNDGKVSLVPLDSEEGTAAFERVRFIHFVQVLQDKIRKRNTDRSIQEWAAYLKELVDDLIFEAGEKEDEDYPLLMQAIEQISLIDTLGEVKVSFEAFRHTFIQQLSSEQRRQVFAGAGITFCSLVPMRSIPFKVIAMLGMDFDKFPRKENPLSFSLISKNPKPGDRNVKDNDKHLFLETLMCAREKLYISYLAKSEKDGSDLPPSSLLDELIDYIAIGLGKDTDELRHEWVNVHPLQSFSKRYFNQSGLISYLDENRYKTGIEPGWRNAEPLQFDFSSIDVFALSRFLLNPPKLYLNKRFSIYYNEEETLLPSHEIFEFEQLDKWTLQQAIMDLTRDESTAFLNQQANIGNAPLRNMGTLALNRVYEEVKALHESVLAITQGKKATQLLVRTEMDGCELSGMLNGIYGQRFVVICNSSNRIKYALQAYVPYLALLAAGHTLEFCFIAKDSEIQSIPMGAITQEMAIATLKTLIGYYKQGHEDYFCFYPALARKDFEILKGDYDEFWEAYEDALKSEYNFNYDDEYLSKAVEHGYFKRENFELFKQYTHGILDPLRSLLPQVFES